MEGDNMCSIFGWMFFIGACCIIYQFLHGVTIGYSIYSYALSTWRKLLRLLPLAILFVGVLGGMICEIIAKISS